MRMFIASQLSQIDELIESINGAPPELVVPALELLIKIYGAIIDKPDEPKVVPKSPTPAPPRYLHINMISQF